MRGLIVEVNPPFGCKHNMGCQKLWDHIDLLQPLPLTVLHMILAVPNSFGFAQDRLPLLQENLWIVVAWGPQGTGVNASRCKTHVLS